jgi:uncharacterized protein
MKRIGLISDTHGLLRPEALAALRGSDLIVHAGDITGPEILDALRALAPVQAVRGNNDQGAWAQALPHTLRLSIEGVTLLVIHDVKELTAEAAEGAQVVVSGHSHKPSVVERGGVLFVNPGSAGPRRFTLPVSVGVLELAAGRASARCLTLDVPAKSPKR